MSEAHDDADRLVPPLSPSAKLSPVEQQLHDDLLAGCEQANVLCTLLDGLLSVVTGIARERYELAERLRNREPVDAKQLLKAAYSREGARGLDVASLLGVLEYYRPKIGQPA